MSLIEVKNISFFYQGNPVIENVSFNIKRGDYIGIVGPNGGGKTTLIKILAGLIKPQSGNVFFEGKPLASFKNKSVIGYVPQRISQASLSIPATVKEIVESGLVVRRGIWKRLNPGDKESVLRALKTAGIEDLKDKLVSELSGGQRQRVYVARALVGNPQIMILDEPFVGIDAAAQKAFYAFLKDLNENQMLTIMLVSHDIDAIAGEVKSVICLNRGMLCFGSPSLLHQPNVIEDLYGKKIIHIHREH